MLEEADAMKILTASQLDNGGDHWDILVYVVEDYSSGLEIQ